MEKLVSLPCRTAITDTITDMAHLDPDIVVVTTDARGSVTLGRFFDELPTQAIECGIAEQDAVGIAAGLAHAGKKVFVCGPACFYVARSLEQVKVDVAYSNNPVKILGVSGGVAYGALGATHHSLHDIAVLRTFPGLEIVLPADAHQARALAHLLPDYPHPVYIRVGRSAVPDVYSADHCPFTIGKANILREGKHLSIIACGETVYHALQAAERLATQGIEAIVVDMHTLKPADTETIVATARATGHVLTVEEHSMAGGLGGIVAETLATHCPTPLRILGIPDENVIHGKPLEIFHYYHLDAEGIAAEALQFLSR